jgi:hypothetical protein
MNATQKKKLADLILERLRAAGLYTKTVVLLRGRVETTHWGFLKQALELLAGNGFETLVRCRSRQGERYYNRRRPPSQRSGEARFKYDPAPKDKGGKIYLPVVTCISYHDANGGDEWKQIWISLDKEIALKMLVLGFLPETIVQTGNK